MRKILSALCKVSNVITDGLDALSSLAVLGIRIYLAKVFFWSGWLKVTSWASTIVLFQNEFKIVGMSAETAAYLATAAELILPVFLLIGFGARIPALLFFVFNVFNVVFYPDLLQPEFAAALKDHIIWGILIAVIIFFGYGKISLDYLVKKKVCSEYKY